MARARKSSKPRQPTARKVSRPMARVRPLAVVYGVSFLGFGAYRAWTYLTEKFVLER